MAFALWLVVRGQFCVAQGRNEYEECREEHNSYGSRWRLRLGWRCVDDRIFLRYCTNFSYFGKAVRCRRPSFTIEHSALFGNPHPNVFYWMSPRIILIAVLRVDGDVEDQVFNVPLPDNLLSSTWSRLWIDIDHGMSALLRAFTLSRPAHNASCGESSFIHYKVLSPISRSYFCRAGSPHRFIQSDPRISPAVARFAGSYVSMACSIFSKLIASSSENSASFSLPIRWIRRSNRRDSDWYKRFVSVFQEPSSWKDLPLACHDSHHCWGKRPRVLTMSVMIPSLVGQCPGPSKRCPSPSISKRLQPRVHTSAGAPIDCFEKVVSGGKNQTGVWRSSRFPSSLSQAPPKSDIVMRGSLTSSATTPIRGSMTE